MKKHLLIFSILASAAFSCEKAIDIYVPFEKSKLVINGFLNPDSSILVHVSQSQFILDEGGIANITDAKVTAYEGAESLGQLVHQKDGLYRLEGVRPKIGRTYRIEAERNGFSTVSGSEKILQTGAISEISVDSLGRDQFGSDRIAIELLLHDPAGEDNYYMFKVLTRGYIKQGYYNPDEPDGENYIWQPFQFEYSLTSSDPVVEDLCLGYYSSCGVALRDDYFDGKNYRLRLIGSSYSWSSFDPASLKDVEVVVILYHIPESFYLYSKTLELNRETRDSPFAEPAKVFTNIEEGFGILSSLTPAVFKAAR